MGEQGNEGTGEAEKVKGKKQGQAAAAVPFPVPDAPFPCSPFVPAFRSLAIPVVFPLFINTFS
jgi:hypothetical protein